MSRIRRCISLLGFKDDQVPMRQASLAVVCLVATMSFVGVLPEIRKRGIRVQGIGQSFFAFIHPDRYAKDHPEYFALMNGKRCTTDSRSGVT